MKPSEQLALLQKAVKFIEGLEPVHPSFHTNISSSEEWFDAMQNYNEVKKRYNDTYSNTLFELNNAIYSLHTLVKIENAVDKAAVILANKPV